MSKLIVNVADLMGGVVSSHIIRKIGRDPADCPGTAESQADNSSFDLFTLWTSLRLVKARSAQTSYVRTSLASCLNGNDLKCGIMAVRRESNG